MLEAVTLKNLSPPAETGTAVNERDLVALGAQPQGSCDTAETSAYNNCFHFKCLNFHCRFPSVCAS